MTSGAERSWMWAHRTSLQPAAGRARARLLEPEEFPSRLGTLETVRTLGSGSKGGDMMGNARRLARSAAALLVVVVIGAGCAPPLEPLDAPRWFDGGTYALDLDVPPSTVETTYPIFGGLVTCTTVVTTPSLEVPEASLTLSPVALDVPRGTVTIPEATVQLPQARLSVGAVSLSCDGQKIGSAGLELRFDAAASTGTAELDVATGQVTLGAPTIQVSNARLVFTGAPSGLGPVLLPPLDLELPTVTVPV